jgi:hypothetical protein
MPGYQSTLVDITGDGSAVTGTSEATLLTAATPAAAARIPIGAGYLGQPGKRLAVRATGRISNIVTTPGTLTLKFKLGSALVATSTAWALNTTAKTNVSWFLDLVLTLRVAGSAANFFPQGSFQSESLLSSAAGMANSAMFQASAPAVGANFDATVANIIDLTAQFSLTGNSIQIHTFALEDLTTIP